MSLCKGLTRAPALDLDAVRSMPCVCCVFIIFASCMHLACMHVCMYVCMCAHELVGDCIRTKNYIYMYGYMWMYIMYENVCKRRECMWRKMHVEESHIHDALSHSLKLSDTPM